jgi:hypothetical protein
MSDANETDFVSIQSGEQLITPHGSNLIKIKLRGWKDETERANAATLQAAREVEQDV